MGEHLPCKQGVRSSNLLVSIVRGAHKAVGVTAASLVLKKEAFASKFS